MNSILDLNENLSAGSFACDNSVFVEKPNREAGFSLVEATVAMVILLISLLGVFITFTYAVSYNAGNNSRAQALAVLQQEVELIRSAKFSPTWTDNYAPSSPDTGKRDITGGVKAQRVVTSANGNRFRVDVTIDDDPFDDPSTLEPDVDATNTKTLKEITVRVTLDNPTPGWQTAIPATVILRRVRSN